LAAIGVLQFEGEAYMKNPVWDDTVPHSKEEIKAEIRRMASELEEMLEWSRQSSERTQLNIQETDRILKRIQERFNVERSL